jgi:hypothetical protein
MYTKRENKATKQKFGADGIRSSDLWIKNPSPYRLSCYGLATSDWQNNVYIAIVITTVKNRTIGQSVIFRHNKHLKFYRSVNIWKLILENFLNYKITETWQKPRTRWIRKLHHFNCYCTMKLNTNSFFFLQWTTPKSQLQPQVWFPGGSGSRENPQTRHPTYQRTRCALHGRSAHGFQGKQIWIHSVPKQIHSTRATSKKF